MKPTTELSTGQSELAIKPEFIRRSFEPLDEPWGERRFLVRCPHCGSNYVHPAEATDDYIVMHCEGGVCAPFKLAIWFAKGQTFVWVER